MPGRVQSPSSINTYIQCPRKYYFQYILKLPTKPSIHLARGHIVHSVLEHFFKIDLKHLNENTYPYDLKNRIQELLVKFWQNEEDLKKLDLSKDKLLFYFDESMLMLLKWVTIFISRVEAMIIQGHSLPVAFKRLTPKTEEQYFSEEFKVQGFIDAIEEIDDIVKIIDYKTSASYDISDSYKLQLAIYALLYKEKHGKLPHKVGINFLKDSEKFIDVDENLVHYAKKEIEMVHKKTQTDDIDNYPLIPANLCKWCDFFHKCFGINGEKYPFKNGNSNGKYGNGRYK